jgi:hypothetical protein
VYLSRIFSSDIAQQTNMVDQGWDTFVRHTYAIDGFVTEGCKQALSPDGAAILRQNYINVINADPILGIKFVETGWPQ